MPTFTHDAAARGSFGAMVDADYRDVLLYRRRRGRLTRLFRLAAPRQAYRYSPRVAEESP